MQTVLIALTAALTVGGVAWTAHEMIPLDAPIDFPFEGLDCSQPLVPFVGAEHDGAIAVTADNHADAGALRVCVYDEARIKRVDLKIPLDAKQGSGRVIDVPVATYGLVLRIEASDQGSATIVSLADLGRCGQQLHQVDTWFQDREHKISGRESRCTEIASVDQAAMGANERVVDDVLSMPTGQQAGPGLIAGGAGLVVALPLVVWRRADLRFLFLGLFSRLQRPRLLDQPTRARIHDLVEHEPGIHGAAIAEALELGTGTMVHHLRVLVRERQLSRVQAFGRAHYFAYGRYPPQQMRLLSAMRHASLRRVYRSVVQRPGLSLSDLSSQAGYSLGQTSKLARRLERAGLVSAQNQGRATRWHPTSAAGAA